MQWGLTSKRPIKNQIKNGLKEVVTCAVDVEASHTAASRVQFQN